MGLISKTPSRFLLMNVNRTIYLAYLGGKYLSSPSVPQFQICKLTKFISECINPVACLLKTPSFSMWPDAGLSLLWGRLAQNMGCSPAKYIRRNICGLDSRAQYSSFCLTLIYSSTCSSTIRASSKFQALVNFSDTNVKTGPAGKHREIAQSQRPQKWLPQRHYGLRLRGETQVKDVNWSVVNASIIPVRRVRFAFYAFEGSMEFDIPVTAAYIPRPHIDSDARK